MGLVPNILARARIGAEVLRAELETLTIAQLSAIEECHRINVRRLRHCSIVRLVPALISGLSGLVVIGRR